MNKVQQGKVLRELFENKMRDVFYGSDEYCYLKRFNLKNRKLGMSNIYRFYPITTEQESYPEGAEFVIRSDGFYFTQYAMSKDISEAMRRYSIGDAYNLLDYFRSEGYEKAEIIPIYPKGV